MALEVVAAVGLGVGVDIGAEVEIAMFEEKTNHGSSQHRTGDCFP